VSTPAATPRPEPVDAAQRALLLQARAALNQCLHGKERLIDLALTTVVAGGHLLLEDVPGVGKTTLAAALARVIGGRFARVQCTADLLPGDVTGVSVLEAGRFVFRPGPVFANVLLADEINRTSPKTQSALFEAMEEDHVTVDGETRPLPSPFTVIATQNPTDHHGTFPLPESQLDRFLMLLDVGYPDRDSEREVLRRPTTRAPLPEPLATPDAWADLRRAAAAMPMPAEIEDDLLDLVRATRETPRLLRGASTRGAQALHRAARAHAIVAGRSYVIPEDVRQLVLPVLAHRVIPRVDAGRGGAARALAALCAEREPPR
jgi:MoxR-like ATPase